MLELKSYAAVSDQGPYLQINEDSVESDLVNGLFMIIDGFGGANIGDRAVAQLKEDVKRFYINIGGDPDLTMPHFYSPRYLIEGNAVINALHFAHQNLKKQNSPKSMNERAGASIMIAALADNLLTLVNVGNCRGLLFRGGELREVIAPDNMEYLSGDFFEKQFHTAPFSAIGLYDDFSMTVKELRVQEDDSLIMLTDGAYSRLSDSELKQILNKPSRGSQKIHDIFNMVNSRGNLDNQSATILDF